MKGERNAYECTGEESSSDKAKEESGYQRTVEALYYFRFRNTIRSFMKAGQEETLILTSSSTQS